MGRIKNINDNLKISFVLVSDTHIDEMHPFPLFPKLMLYSALKDCKKSISRQSAFVIDGDITSRGSDNNWKMAVSVFKIVNKPADFILPAIGNHDGWSDEGSEKAIERYLKNRKLISDIKSDKTYFSREINGYRFIVLGSENDNGCCACISDEQINWLKAELESASTSKKPIFVFCHQSLNCKHGLPLTFDRNPNPNADDFEGGIGEKSDEIENLLLKYDNVFYFSGHSHMGFMGCKSEEQGIGYSSFETYGNLTAVNLPSLSCGNHHGVLNDTGMGVVVEVYEDAVYIRPRSFKKRKWIKLNILNSKNYFKKEL
ncbi:MAG: metallophosphoesterase [Clostridiales bacterium]|nr:metallophosphoesterase [Clostridiales bacterium]